MTVRFDSVVFLLRGFGTINAAIAAINSKTIMSPKTFFIDNTLFFSNEIIP
jgi:hypothetical protein